MSLIYLGTEGYPEPSSIAKLEEIEDLNKKCLGESSKANRRLDLSLPFFRFQEERLAVVADQSRTLVITNTYRSTFCRGIWTQMMEVS